MKKLANYVEILLGGTPATNRPDFWDGEIPWVSIVDFANAKKIYTTEKSITEAGLRESNTKLLNEGDVIVSARGTVGKVVVCGKRMAFNQSCYALSTKDKNKLSQSYLFYLLQEKIKYLRQRAVGGVFNTIIKSTLEKIPVELPDIDTQEEIALTLSAYDDLIDTNRRRMQLLEETARLLFREWFVYFRFPRLRQGFGGQAGHEKACPVESRNSTGVKIIDGVPEGWRKRRLVEVADITMGQSPKSEYYNDNGEGLPFHQGVTGFGNRYPTNQTYCTQKNRMAQSGDILFSVRAPVGRINISTEKIIIGRGISAIRSKENHQSYLFYELKNHFFKEDMIGGGAIFAAITKKDLETVVTIVPDEKAIDQFENITNPIDRQIFILSNQNQKLVHARDLLLPRLMSGAIDPVRYDKLSNGVEA